ncbi:MAG: DUF4301 family protein [Candidatus Binatia bacterium]
MFSDADRARFAAAGIPPEEVDRQIALFTDPPPPMQLERPCTIGDGVQVLSTTDRAAALEAHAEASAAGRVSKFTPASGAASRMFQSLLAVRGSGPLARAAVEARASAGEADARETLRFADNVDRFAFADAVRGALARGGRDPQALLDAGDLGALLDAVLDANGLDYAAAPKGLLPFHRYPDGARTGFEEHLVEAAAVARDARGIARLHFTVSPAHAERFAALLEAVRAAHERRSGARFDVGFSSQKPSTDTIAVDAENRPFRTAAGEVVLRPGGHGALIENLQDLQADIALIKNIDNVQPDHLRAITVEWMRVLGGHLARLQRELAGHVAALTSESPPSHAALSAARRCAAERLGLTIPAEAGAAELAQALERPVRVCGVVRNTGEPGGGPFWVRGPSGRLTVQIVESAQVDARDPAQAAVFDAATHFNPVLLACGLRNRAGRPFDLRAFIDPSAVFIARKSFEGRELKALERPGLWNGAMAHWITVFVEVPEAVFTPVKTANDLLGPAHQPPA